MINALRRACCGAFDLLLAQDCFLCGAPSAASPLCTACRAALPANGPSCPVCALPTPGAQVCGYCLKRPPPFDASFAAFSYSHPADALLQAYKFGGRLELAGMFSGALQQVLGDRAAARPDLIVPVPLHAERLKTRGFNQAALIAQPLARAYGVPLGYEMLQRIAPTSAQAGLNLRQRRRNLRGAFMAQAADGLSIALVDDVMTSGTTLAECARCLKQRGARQVSCWVIARTPPPRP
ncbi:MAG: ComF family protein [Rhodocyclaceae bacterium]|nr:ComF family protein [Rhodocyclaceae bacterium]MBX3668879.1 ComF family protein [Rhodocyclaceae bacterium]